MRKFAFSGLVIFTLAFAMTIPASGAGKKKKAGPEAKSHETLISNVSANAITVTDDTSARTFMITQFTDIHVNGQKAGIADLKPRMKVTVTIGLDPSRASRINATNAP